MGLTRGRSLLALVRKVGGTWCGAVRSKRYEELKKKTRIKNKDMHNPDFTEERGYEGYLGLLQGLVFFTLGTCVYTIHIGNS